MKQYKIVRAHEATESLSKCENLNVDTLWAIYQLRKKLYPHVEFQLERDKALKEKYSEFADEEGMIRGKPYNDFLSEKEKLANLEVEDIDLSEKIKIKLQDGIGITVQMMEDLEDFIEFVKE